MLFTIVYFDNKNGKNMDKEKLDMQELVADLK